MIQRLNLVVYKFCSSKTAMIPMPIQQYEEQQEQVSSADCLDRSVLLPSFFLCFPCQKQLGPELSLYLQSMGPDEMHPKVLRESDDVVA